MMHSEVGFIQSKNVLFNPKIVILWVSSTIVPYKPIFSKKVQTTLKS